MEIIFLSIVNNLNKVGFHYSKRYKDGSITRHVMRPGLYSSIVQVVRELRRLGRMGNVQLLNWEYSASKKRISFTFATGLHIGNAAITVTMSDYPGALIGFDRTRGYPFSERSKTYVSERLPSLTARFENVYVYCDILECAGGRH